jgi:hypothetical protein
VRPRKLGDVALLIAHDTVVADEVHQHEHDARLQRYAPAVVQRDGQQRERQARIVGRFGNQRVERFDGALQRQFGVA